MVFWWGIVRGAIYFALSLRKTTEHSPIIITTTFAIVIITTFIGSLTETFLICIGMKNVKLILYMYIFKLICFVLLSLFIINSFIHMKKVQVVGNQLHCMKYQHLKNGLFILMKLI